MNTSFSFFGAVFPFLPKLSLCTQDIAFFQCLKAFLFSCPISFVNCKSPYYFGTYLYLHTFNPSVPPMLMHYSL